MKYLNDKSRQSVTRYLRRVKKLGVITFLEQADLNYLENLENNEVTHENQAKKQQNDERS